MTPVIVIVRDRLTCLQACLASLEPYGLDIHLVDHGSTWDPMVEWLHTSPYPVHWRGDLPPRALWDWNGLSAIVGNRRYIVTDPDVVLDCPHDWLRLLAANLSPDVVKVGLGLRLDDLPDTSLATKVRAWEAPFWHSSAGPGVWRAPVDTTLALYQPLTVEPRFRLHPAIRLDAPYLLRHLPWYAVEDTAEEAHYRERIQPGASHWAHGGW